MAAPRWLGQRGPGPGRCQAAAGAGVDTAGPAASCSAQLRDAVFAQWDRTDATRASSTSMVCSSCGRAGHNRKPTFLRSCGGPAVTRLALFARHSRRSPALPPQGRPARSPAGSASVSRRRSRASRSRGSVCGSLRGTASRPRRSASADRQCGGTTGICGTAVGARKWRAHQGSKKHMDWMGVRFGW